MVIEAENGRAALERMAETCPDLIFLDLVMPEMDGFKFIAELHKNREWQTIPVVVELPPKTLPMRTVCA